jgi:hypothetical protein
MKENPSIYIPVLKSTVTLGNPVLHVRYLWHVNYNQHSCNWLIAKQGLVLPRNGAVFAHNALQTFEGMFPYFVDKHDCWFPNRRKDGARFDAYSFWRIDTQRCSFPWYADPGMQSDAEFLGLPAHHYLCTPNAIPPEALMLFGFNLDNYLFRNPRIIKREGSLHVRPVRSDFDTLVPNTEINNYIRKAA